MFLRRIETYISYFHSNLDEQQELVERGEYVCFLLVAIPSHSNPLILNKNSTLKKKKSNLDFLCGCNEDALLHLCIYPVCQNLWFPQCMPNIQPAQKIRQWQITDPARKGLESYRGRQTSGQIWQTSIYAIVGECVGFYRKMENRELNVRKAWTWVF